MNFEIADKSTEINLNWYDALIYCEFLNHQGVGWRLPTLNELEEISKTKHNHGYKCFWAVDDESATIARAFNTVNNSATYGYKGGKYYVRAVRNK